MEFLRVMEMTSNLCYFHTRANLWRNLGAKHLFRPIKITESTDDWRDNQSVTGRSEPREGSFDKPNAQGGSVRGYDGRKLDNSRKCHILVDTLSLLLAVT